MVQIDDFAIVKPYLLYNLSLLIVLFLLQNQTFAAHPISLGCSEAELWYDNRGQFLVKIFYL